MLSTGLRIERNVREWEDLAWGWYGVSADVYRRRGRLRPSAEVHVLRDGSQGGATSHTCSGALTSPCVSIAVANGSRSSRSRVPWRLSIALGRRGSC
jgi:hypothetical protein